MTDWALAIGETLFTSGATFLSLSALTSLSVSVIARLWVPVRFVAPRPPPGKPPPPAKTVRTFVPSPSIRFCTSTAEPLPTATSTITAATPMLIPSTVNADRSRLAAIPRIAIGSLRDGSRRCPRLRDVAGHEAGRQTASPGPVALSSRMLPSRRVITRFAAPATSCSWVIRMTVRPATLSRQSTCRISPDASGVEVAGRLVGEDDRGIADDRARDGDPLLLTARELGREVPRAVGEPDASAAPRGPARVAPWRRPARRRAAARRSGAPWCAGSG